MNSQAAPVRRGGRLPATTPTGKDSPSFARGVALAALALLLATMGACSDTAGSYWESAGQASSAGAGGEGAGPGGGGAPGRGGAGASPSGGSGSVPSEGCGRSPPSDRYYESRDVDGTTRTFYVMPPSGVQPGDMVPLLIGYHWHDGSGQEMGDNADLRAMDGRVLAIYPDGLPQDWLGGARAWEIHDTNSIDIPMTRSVIDYAKEHFCIDTQRVFAYGISWGGWMANLAGCALGAELNGIAPVAGGGPHYPDGSAAGCAGAVPTIVFHGTNDADEPVTSAYATTDAWKTLNSCSDRTTPGDPALCANYEGCSRGAPLVFCEHQDGHGLPTEWGMAKIWSFFMGL